MADYSDPKRATAYRFTLSLFARSDNQIKTAPTLAAGDVKVSKDNGATANITTLPSEAPASSGILQVDLSATEMTADLVTVIFRDAAGAEWNDVAVNIAPGVRQMADLAFPNTSGRGMDVDANGGVEVGSFQAGAITAAAFTAGAIDASSIAADAIGAAELAADAVTEIAAGVWDRLTSGLTTVGSAGKLLVDNLNATVSSRASQTSVDTVDDFLDTEIAAIKAKTDNLPADPADASDIASSFSTVNSTLSTIAGYIDTEVATIVSQTGASAIRAAVGLASANLDTQIGTLATAANLSTVAGYLDTEIAAILADTNELQADWADGGRLDLLIDAINAKTTNLPSDPADASVIAGRFDTLDTSVADLPTNAELATALGTADDAVLTQVALVKAKTDLIPASPAATGDIPTADITAIKAKTDNLPTDPADQSALAALIAAVTAPTANENADALLDRTAGVETGLTVRQAMRLMAAVLFGKASGMTSTTAVFRDFGDTKDRITATVDSGGNRTSVTLDAT